MHHVIIGSGLAGAFMAARLCLHKQKVTLIHSPQKPAASQVAAGLFNVITGRFGAKSWEADRLLAEIESFLQIPIFAPLKKHIHYTPIYRPFKTIKEYNKWTGRTQNPNFAHLFSFQGTSIHPEHLNNPLGGIMITPCGWVDIPTFINTLLSILQSHFNLTRITQDLPFTHLNPQSKTLQLSQQSLSYDHLIIAQGAYTSTNPLFPQVSIIPNKGETLLLKIPNLNLPFILSRRIYLIPKGDDLYVTGSTYQNTFAHPNPTPEGREQISSFLQQAITLPFSILDQRAGLRPTTPDRKPIIGTHTLFPFIHICSGFGTKGVLLAPYCSKVLANHILNPQSPIPPEINLSRFQTF